MSPARPDSAQREAVRRLLEKPRLEILPLSGVLPQLKALPESARLTITASPSKGLETSLEVGETLRAAGFEVTIHLSARMVADRDHLRLLLSRMEAAGLDRAFVIGGDAPHPGIYPDAGSLLDDMAELGHHVREIGIAGYPQGHATIPDDRLLAALRAKAPHASYVTTQLCFDADATAAWIAARRSEGLELPIEIGLPGAVEMSRLLRISARIGIADAGRFASKQIGLVRRLLRPGGYRPDGLLADLAPVLADPAANIRGLHIFTFNQVDRTEEWRSRYLERR